MLAAFTVFASADFGDYSGDSDYGGSYSGGYDYSYSGGSSSYGSSGSSSYGSSNDSEPATKYYSLKEFPDGNVNTGDYILYNSAGEVIDAQRPHSKEDDSGYEVVLGAMVLGAIIIVIASVAKRNSVGSYRPKGRPTGKSTPVVTGVTAQPTQNLNPMSEYVRLDPGFSENDLKEKISNMYVKLQNAWQDKNLEEVRPYLTDALYGQYDRQLDAYRRNRQTNYVERIAVLSVDLRGWRQDGANDMIYAVLNTRIVDYVVNDADNTLVRGSRTQEKFMSYEWTLTRTKGAQTAELTGIHTIHCPNCGATVDINKSAKCEYCGSILTTQSSDWTINGIKGLSQRTGR